MSLVRLVSILTHFDSEESNKRATSELTKATCSKLFVLPALYPSVDIMKRKRRSHLFWARVYWSPKMPWNVELSRLLITGNSVRPLITTFDIHCGFLIPWGYSALRLLIQKYLFDRQWIYLRSQMSTTTRYQVCSFNFPFDICYLPQNAKIQNLKALQKRNDS